MPFFKKEKKEPTSSRSSTYSTSSMSKLKNRAAGFIKGRKGFEQSPFFDTSTLVTKPKPPVKQEPALDGAKKEEEKDEAKLIQKGKQAEQAGEKEDERQEAKQVTKAVHKMDPVPEDDSVEATTAITRNKAVLSGPYAVLQDHEKSDLFRSVQTGLYSYYTPNAVSLFFTLDSMHRQLVNNEHLRWDYRSYLSLPVSVYYSVLYYIRILEVRETIGGLKTAESRFLRTFFRKYKREELVIAGPLVPIFNAIAAYDVDDDRVSFLLPDFRSMMTTTDEAARAANNYSYALNIANRLIQPDPLVVLDYLHTFATSTTTALYGRQQNETFAPIKSTTANYYLGRHQIHHAAFEAVELTVTGGLAVGKQFPETIDKYVEVLADWRLKKTAQLRATHFGALGATQAETLQSFLGFGDDEFEWFGDCIDQAVIQAKFFKYPKFLGNLKYRGGFEIGVLTDTGINTARGSITHAHAQVPEYTLGLAPIFYPNILRKAQSNVKWREQEVRDIHKQIGRHCLGNSSFNIHYATIAHDAAPGTAPTARHYEPLLDTAAEKYRWGPFFNHDIDGRNPDGIDFTSDYGATAAPVDTLDRRDQMINRHYYIAEGL